MTHLQKINKALRQFGDVRLYRSPSGYYYFTGEYVDIPSLYYYNVKDCPVKEVVEHVRKYLQNR